MKKEINGVLMNVPEHVAIIMDGNGRWAKKRHMPRNYGHAAGSRIVETIVRDAYELGIRYLTVYAFSTENWSRPESEVKALMKLLESYLTDCIAKAKKNNMRVRVIGDISRLNPKIQALIRELEEVSKDLDGIQFTIALNYGGRDEIVRAVRKLCADVRDGNLEESGIDEKRFSAYLDTFDMPDPELLIRTSGEQRISNYLLWQLAYSEMYFTDVLWPDFNREEMIRAIEFYNGRNRRFGGV